MKIQGGIILTLCIGCTLIGMEGAVSGVSGEPARLQVSFVDPAWDGKTVPVGQQCLRFGGETPSTPRLMVRGIPPEANAIIMEYSDRSYAPMDDGGHGMIGYRIPEGTKEVVVPSVPGHSFDMPEGFFVVSPHRVPGWATAGAYLPPCSGGRGNHYSVTVKAVHQPSAGSTDFTVLGQASLELGTY